MATSLRPRPLCRDRLLALCDLLPQTSELISHRAEDDPRAAGHDFFVSVVIDSLLQDGVVERCVLGVLGIASDPIAPHRRSDDGDCYLVSRDIFRRIFACPWPLGAGPPQLPPADSPVTSNNSAAVLHLIASAIAQWTHVCVQAVRDGAPVPPCHLLNRFVLTFQRSLLAMMSRPTAAVERLSMLDFVGTYLRFLASHALVALKATYTAACHDGHELNEAARGLLRSLPVQPLAELLVGLLAFGTDGNVGPRVASGVLAEGSSQLKELLLTLDQLAKLFPQRLAANLGDPLESGEDNSSATAAAALIDLGQTTAYALGRCARVAALGTQGALNTPLDGYLSNPVFDGGMAAEAPEPGGTAEALISLPSDPRTQTAIALLEQYVREQRRNTVGLSQDHPTWEAMVALLGLLAYHLELEPELETGLRDRSFASEALADILKASVALQQHFARLHQEKLLEYEDLTARLRAMARFLYTHLAPCRPATENAAPRRASVWLSSRKRIVSVSEMPPAVAPEALASLNEPSTPLEDERTFADLANSSGPSRQGSIGWAAQELDEDLAGQDWQALVNMASTSWLSSKLFARNEIAVIPKHVAELVCAFVAEPFELQLLQRVMEAQRKLANRRCRVFLVLTEVLELGLDPGFDYTLVHGLLGTVDGRPRQAAQAAQQPLLGQSMAGIAVAPAPLRLRVRSAGIRFWCTTASILERVGDSLCASTSRPVVGEGPPQETLPLAAAAAAGDAASGKKKMFLRLLHAFVHLLFEKHDASTLDALLRADFLGRVATLQAHLFQLARTELEALQSANASTQDAFQAGTAAAVLSSSGGSGDAVPVAESTAQAPDAASTAARNSGGSEGQTLHRVPILPPVSPTAVVDAGAWDALPVMPNCAELEVSSKPAQASALVDGSLEKHWTSSGKRGEHWILLKIRPHICIRSLRLVAKFNDTFCPRSVCVMAGHSLDSLQQIANVSWQPRLPFLPVACRFPQGRGHIPRA